MPLSDPLLERSFFSLVQRKPSLGSSAEGSDLTMERRKYFVTNTVKCSAPICGRLWHSQRIFLRLLFRSPNLKKKTNWTERYVLVNNLGLPANWRERGLASPSRRHREARAAGRATTRAGVTVGTPGRSPLGAPPPARQAERVQRTGHPRLPTGVRGNPQAACNKGGLVRNQTAS